MNVSASAPVAAAVAAASSATPRREQWPIAVAFAVGLVLLIGTAAFGARENHAESAARAQLTEHYETLLATLEIENAVSSMEARHRAFLVTGEAEFERRRDASRREAGTALEALRRRSDAAPLAAALGELAAAVEVRHALMQQASALAGSAGLDAGRAAFRGTGSGSLDPILERLRQLRAQQRQALGAQHEESARRSARLDRVLLGGTSLALAMLLFAGWALRRQVSRAATIGRRLDRVGAMQQAMLENGGLIIVAVRPDGVIRLFNRAASQALGYRADEVIGRHTPALFHDEQELRARAAELTAQLGVPVEGFEVFAALPRRGEVDRREWTFVRKDGTRFPVGLAVSAVRDESGAEHGFIGMALDLTERRRAEDAVAALAASLQAKAEALSEANAELESFSYSVSHDLRAPLRHIDGYARILEEEAGEQLAPEFRHYLQRIAHSARRMGALIDDLLAFSRLARASLQAQPVPMAALVRDALRELGAAPGAVAVGELPDVPGDASLLRQVWTNLLSNALKYSAPRGAATQIVVQGRVTGEVAVFEVSDNGVGFDMRYRDRLFGVFQRLHAQDEFEGTGIGLAIVQRIVRRHGGRVDASGEPGKGATFRFELPLEGAA